MTSDAQAWIHGKLLNSVIEKTKASHSFGKFSDKTRLSIDIARDADLLGRDFIHGVPFAIDGNLFVTIHDFDDRATPKFIADEEVIHLANIRLSRRALEGARFWNQSAKDFPSTGAKTPVETQIETMGRELDLADPDAGLEFSRQVVEWGEGKRNGRVWANIRKKNRLEDKRWRREYGEAICAWLRTAKCSYSPGDALEPGIRIDGLAVSFASKHLRLFDPERFATLDEIICNALGYARNIAGYNLWLHDLQALKRDEGISLRIGDLEAAIFLMARQMARTKSDSKEKTREKSEVSELRTQ